MLDDDDNIYVAANERNAVAVVTDEGRAVELYRNPVGADRLRNAGPLEFPTSPVLVGRKLCMTNSDGDRRDNSPPTRRRGRRRSTGVIGTAEAGVGCSSVSPVSASKACRRAGSTLSSTRRRPRPACGRRSRR